MHVAADLNYPLDKGDLQKWPETNLGPGYGHFNMPGISGQGGDLECIPPWTGTLPYNKLGIVMVGSECSALEDFFVNQNVQLLKNAASGDPIVKLSTSWLDVGHVDEIVNFVATDKVLIADPKRAIRLLEALDKSVTRTAEESGYTYIIDIEGFPSDSESGGVTADISWMGGFIEITSGPCSGQVRQISNFLDNRIEIAGTNPFGVPGEDPGDPPIPPGNNCNYRITPSSAYSCLFDERSVTPYQDCGVVSSPGSSILHDNTKWWTDNHWKYG